MPEAINTIQTVITCVSVTAAIVFGIIATRHSSAGDVEKRIQDAEERAASDSRINSKLSEIGTDTKEIKSDMRCMKNDMKEQSERLVIVEQSTRSAHKRIDDIMKGAKKE